MPNTERTLPLYEYPPVIETVLGVQFNPLKDFSIPHFGLYWQKIREIYPTYEIKPILPRVFEQFDSPQKPSTMREIEFRSLSFPNPQDCRCWFINEKGTQLIQLQKDKFITNWRKNTGKEIYPQYEDFVLPNFRKEWNIFFEFLASENIASPVINQCEITYVNHIEVDREIKHAGEISKVFSFWSPISNSMLLKDPEAFQFSIRYLMPDGKGRLHVQVNPMIRNRDGKEILQLNLTARGKPDSTNLEDICKWFNFGRKWIVQGFTELTTLEMHEMWRRKI